MRVQTTSAQVWWIALADEIRPTEGLDVGATYAALKEAFGFAAIPAAPAQGGGMEFVNGVLRTTDRPIVITKISVFNDGLGIDVPSNTQNAETILQAVLAFFYSVGVREPTTPVLHYYLSTVVADLDHSLDNLIPPSLLKLVEKATQIEGRSQFASISINMDKSTIPGRIGPINPSLFNIARRIDVSYETNRYYSQANVTTAEHLAILEEFERVAGRAKA